MSSSKAILKQVMAERLRAMGDEPSTEMLAEWREGRLSDEERELLLERAAVDPAFAKELLDVLDFPEIPSEEPWDDATRDRKWQGFSERFRSENALPAEQPKQVEQTPAPLPFGRPERLLDRKRWLPFAAALILGLGLGLFIPSFFSTGPGGAPPSVDGSGVDDPATSPLGNVETFVVNLGGGPDGGGARGGTMALAGTVEAVLLVMSAAELPTSESYACRVFDSNGVEVFRKDGLIPGSGALLSIVVPSGQMAAGGYRIELYPRGDFGGEVLASGLWTVTLAP